MRPIGRGKSNLILSVLAFPVFGLLMGGCAGVLSGDGDDNNGPAANQPPVIIGDTVTVNNVAPETGQSITLSITTSDPENQALTYAWDDGNATAGEFTGSGASVFWNTTVAGAYVISVTVTDTKGATDTETASLTVTQAVVNTPNDPPAFTDAGIAKDVTAPVAGQKIIFTATAVDPNGDPLSFIWEDNTGQENFADPAVGADGKAKIWWTAPASGSFTITAIANDGRSGSRVISTTVAVDTGVNVGAFPSSFNFVGAEHCSNCHPDIYATEQMTSHAHREDNMQAAGLGRLESCRGCHNVGWQNGGYIDYELTPQFANVQCESCHGSGVGHPANGKLPLNFDPAQSCGTCHIGSHHPTYTEWQTSGHATFDISAEAEEENIIEAACIKCHNGEWFVKIQINGEAQPEEDLPAGSGAHISCATCHDPHDAKYEYQLRVDPEGSVTIPFDDTVVSAGAANTCLMCHNGRRKRSDMEKTIAQGGRGFHGNSQGPMIYGIGGYEFEGVTYDKEHPHNTWNQGKCITCHMYTEEFVSEEDPAITGHSFKPQFESCLACHTFGSAEDMQTYVEAYQEDTEVLIAEFEAAWPAAWKETGEEGIVLHNAPDKNDPPAYDGPPIGDPNGDLYRAAWWNYNYVKADSSRGVHNPAYSRSLLESAIDKVNELNALP